MIGSNDNSSSIIQSKNNELESNRTNNVAERLVWMSTTSQDVGAYSKSDIETHNAEIRRILQEKCSNTQILLSYIRRYTNNIKFITPGEFKFIMLKFGIALPTALANKLFRVYDVNNKGQILFEDFADKIMNLEFKISPSLLQDKLKRRKLEDKEVITSIHNTLKSYPKIFSYSSDKISFLEFLSELSNYDIKVIHDKHVRKVFFLLDKNPELGYIERKRLLKWIKTDVIDPREMRSQSGSKTSTIYQILTKISGPSTKYIERSLRHIPENINVIVPLSEFKSYLLNEGIVADDNDLVQLFMLVSGKESSINIDSLRKAFTVKPYDIEDEVSKKKYIDSSIKASRAERHLRESIRKAFYAIKNDILSISKQNNDDAFISTNDLHCILNKQCLPISFQDFRFILRNVSLPLRFD